MRGLLSSGGLRMADDEMCVRTRSGEGGAGDDAQCMRSNEIGSHLHMRTGADAATSASAAHDTALSNTRYSSGPARARRVTRHTEELLG